MVPDTRGAGMMQLRPWSEEDLWVIERFLSHPAMMEYLGGPQSEVRILDAHRRYLATGASGDGRMFTVLLAQGSTVAGNIGWWNRTWRDEPIHETGWSVFPEHQRRGFAGEAAAMLVARLRQEHGRRHLHAFPSVANVPSNAICARLGFANLGECAVEYPAGHPMRCNDWCLDLFG